MVAPHFVAGADWQLTDTGWVCTDAAPILRWMVGKPPEQVAAYLRRKGWEYQWL